MKVTIVTLMFSALTVSSQTAVNNDLNMNVSATHELVLFRSVVLLLFLCISFVTSNCDRYRKNKADRSDLFLTAVYRLFSL